MALLSAWKVVKEDPWSSNSGLFCQLQPLLSLVGRGCKGKAESGGGTLSIQVIAAKTRGCNRPSTSPALHRIQIFSLRLKFLGVPTFI